MKSFLKFYEKKRTKVKIHPKLPIGRRSNNGLISQQYLKFRGYHKEHLDRFFFAVFGTRLVGSIYA